MERMDRRQFIKSQLGGAAVLSLGAAGLLRPSLVRGAEFPDIVAVEGSPAAAARAAVKAMGGMSRFVKIGQSVLIKANMSFPRGPESATTTYPEVVKELAVMCREAGAAKIQVLDNPLAPSEQCLERSGIRDICLALDKDMVRMVEKRQHFTKVDIPKGKAMRQTEVMKEALSADVLIAAPVAKSHSAGGVSLTLKGMMGLIYNRGVMHWRYELSTAIVDLNTILRPALVVVDATRVLSSGGPGGPGTIIKAGTIIASTDPVAADAYTVASFEWYGQHYQPGQVPHILEAHQRGLGRLDVEKLNVKRMTL
jgi:uncharacterized protein (DUF362 family)